MSRRVRGVAAVAVIAALLAGTFWGDDDHFPFGPFRMYSTTNDPDGTVKEVRVEGVATDGTLMAIPFSHFGLRRAEVEGQLDRFVDDPSLLRHLYSALEHFGPPDATFVSLRLVLRVHRLEDARPVSFEDHVVTTWTRT